MASASTTHLFRHLGMVFAIYLLACYSLLYVTYKKHDLAVMPHDHVAYFSMADNIVANEATNPYKYRVLTPFIVGLCRSLPMYDPDIASELPAAHKKHFFYFGLINLLFLCAAGSLVYYTVCTLHGLGPAMGLVGGLATITSFSSSAFAMVASTDGGALFFVALLYVLYKTGRLVPYIVWAVVGVLQKETVVIALGIYLVVDWFFTKELRIVWLAGLLPGLAVYLCLRALLPATGFGHFFSPQEWVSALLSIFRRSTYSSTFIFHVFLANVPLAAALAGHVLLKARGRAVDYPMHLLLTVPALFLLGMVLQIGNNTGRIMFFAWPWIAPYVMAVVEGVLGEAGGKSRD